MDEAFEETCPATGVDRIAVEVVFHDVVGLHQGRRQRARHQESLRVARVSNADMTEAVEHGLIGQDVVGSHEVGDQGRIDRAARGGPGRSGALRGCVVRHDGRKDQQQEYGDVPGHQITAHGAFPLRCRPASCRRAATEASGSMRQLKIGSSSGNTTMGDIA